MRRGNKKTIVWLLLCSLLFGTVPMAESAAAMEGLTVTTPKLLITELVPDSANVGGADGYEFVEVYNNSQDTINFKDYGIHYVNDKVTTAWPLSTKEDILIPPGKAIVLWVMNAKNGSQTAADFNKNYSTDLIVNSDLFRFEAVKDSEGIIISGGMSNAGPRSLAIKDASGILISQATYQTDAQTQENKGIFYKIPTSIGSTEMMMMEGAGTLPATPGSITSEQITLPTFNAPPVINHIPVMSASVQSDLAIMAEILNDESQNGDKNDPVTATLFYKTISQQFFTASSMSSSAGGFNFEGLIGKSAMVEPELQYYIQAKDKDNTVTTSTYTVGMEGLPAFDSSKVPPLLITELVPDSVNRLSSDDGEFIELYNNTNKEINFSDYKIYYRYPDSGPDADVIWPTDREDIRIPAQSTMVFWVINSANKNQTVADFNASYGTQLVENKDIVKIYSDGMANGSKRGVVVGTNTHKEIASVYYDGSNKMDVAAGKGIFYKYPVNGSTTLIKYNVGVENATPGKVDKAQVPSEPIDVQEDTIAPTITDVTGQEKIDQSSHLELIADAQDDRNIKSVSVYFKTNMDAEYTKHYLYQDYSDTMYHYMLASPNLIAKTYVDYYFEASDGTHTSKSSVKRVSVTGGPDRSELRLNVKNDDVVSGTYVLKGTAESADTDSLQLTVDGNQLDNSYRALENDAYFAFEAAEVNYYFKNAVTVGDEILYTFMDPINTYETLSYSIDSARLKEGVNAIAIRAGTKTGPFDDRPEENRDDFQVRNVRLVLSDGTTIYDPAYSDKNKDIKIGDSSITKPKFIDFKFPLTADKMHAKASDWDTKALADGVHTIAVKDGSKEVSAKVTVDNTAPVIVPSVEDGKTYRGTIKLAANVTDVLAGLASTKATLDGSVIEFPYETTSGKLTGGEHLFVIEATDKAGNKAEKTIRFIVPNENPDKPQLVSPLKGDILSGSNSVKLTVKASDPSEDIMNLTFMKGFNYDATSKSGFAAYKGVSDIEPPKQIKPDGDDVMDGADYSKIQAADGEYLVNDSADGFPYHRFTIQLDETVKATDRVDIQWKGNSLEGRKVSIYAWSMKDSRWALLDYKVAGEEDFDLGATVKAGEYNNGGTINVMVQDELPVKQDSYDFSFIWMSDTQYYSESYPEIYQKNVEWIVEQQEAMNIKYVIHTGDIVDKADQEFQWQNANKSMKVLDDSGIPYGVLAGNHDVSHQTGDYSYYWKHYGEDRFKNQPTYGGSYQNNRGHFDLISAGGVDFIIVYMGWNIDDEQIDWINQVVQDHPDRKAILAFHEYMLVSNNRAPIADKIFERVVVPNKNVIATLSGHYHDAETLVDEIDDNGDGVPDRKVYQMLADYQGAEKGGLGYIRLMQFDLQNNQVHMKTYSPYLNDYNYYDPNEFPRKDEFDLDVDLTTMVKRVATDYFGVKVYTDQKIGQATKVASGSEASAVWEGLAADHYYQWYVVAEDANSGYTLSDIWSFATGDVPSGGNEGGNNGGNGGTEVKPIDPTEPTEKPSFTDTKLHWAKEAIAKLAEQQIITGYPDGTFKPNNHMNRAEYAAVVYRLMGLKTSTGNSPSFTDVGSDKWYTKYVTELSDAGIINGFEDGTFRPNQDMTREEAFVILYRGMKDKLVVASGTAEPKFADGGKISVWAQEAAAALVKAGVIKGYEDGTLRPKNTITRAEIAEIAAFFLK
ncbi:S-layer homology domain-containing protein [Bacillus sp. FJAT-28004]|uniref:S-layer homology domain-containing protein n=1 Tax=Bacillus sp. FJAT-28004 TaxID=1679165 RepID=UPI0006B67A0D|nr:S-layer homology domain-containing protein [Bacillus sp. FJAT-28004]